MLEIGAIFHAIIADSQASTLWLLQFPPSWAHSDIPSGHTLAKIMHFSDIVNPEMENFKSYRDLVEKSARWHLKVKQTQFLRLYFDFIAIRLKK